VISAIIEEGYAEVSLAFSKLVLSSVLTFDRLVVVFHKRWNYNNDSKGRRSTTQIDCQRER
jgi:hypothetical protein